MASVFGMLLVYAAGALLFAVADDPVFQGVAILAMTYAAYRFGGIVERWESMASWDGQDFKDTDNRLPKIGSEVLFYVNSRGCFCTFTVTGYYVWEDLGGNPRLHRVFVRGVDEDGFHNARMLGEIRYPEEKS